MSATNNTPPPVPPSVSRYLASLGAKGGASGTGESKTRSRAHYKRAGLASARARAERREKELRDNPPPPKRPRGRPPKNAAAGIAAPAKKSRKARKETNA